MARFVVSAAAAVVGFIYGGPVVAAQAFAVTYGLTGFLDPNQQVSGPRIDDLKGTTAEYGTPVSHVYAHPRLAGAIVWCSDKREIATTEEAGGKGGPSTDVTTYTYEIDCRYLLTANEIAGVRRIWSNGKLIWSAANDANEETLQASAETNSWRRITVYTGDVGQMPDPTEEAALGIENCPAYRGRGSVFIEGLNLGGSGFLPNLTFEVVRIGDPGVSGEEFSLNYNQDPPVEQSQGATVSASGTPGSNDSGRGIFQNSEYYYCSSSNSYAPTDLVLETEFEISADARTTSPVNIISIKNNPPSIEYAAIAYAGASGPSERGFYFIIGNSDIHWLIPAAEFIPGISYTVRGEYVHATTTATLYINDAPVATGTLPQAQTLNSGFTVRFGLDGALTDPADVHLDNSSIVIGVPGTTISANDEPLEDVLEDLSIRAGIPQSYLDFSSCEGQFVKALAVSQVTPARTVMELLGSAYLQEFVETNSLKTVARGGASVDTVPYVDMGATTGDSVEPLPLKRLNDVELSAQVAITYVNVLNDYQKGTEYSDRLLGAGTGVSTTELALGLTPQEAKRIADVRLTDAVASIIQAGPVGLLPEYAHLEPADVVVLTGHDDSTYRVRIVKITDDGLLRTLECVLDDATVINSEALTDEDYESTSIVRRLLATDLVLFDSPIFRDADNDAGIYAAVNRSAVEGDWPGAVLFRGVNETGWSEIVRYTDRTWLGTTTTDLDPWTGGWLSDEASAVTVSGIGELSSTTDDAIINGTAPAYLIGSEVLYARTATLVSPGVYTLSGLYRGRRGTEWAAALGTESGADVVLLQTSGAGVRRVGFENGQLGAEFDFRAVTLGASIGSADTESITPMGIGLKPFAPVHVEADDNGDGTYDVTWQRRTRLSCRFTGSLGINTPLGESSESYAVEVFDGVSVTSTQTVSEEAATVTASPGDVVRVYQVSAIVGRGYVAELTL